MSFLTAVLAVAIWVACFYFPTVWTLTGIGEADKPFLDLQNLLSAGETAQRGIDPHVSNPLDPYHRLHGYTDWWLVSGAIGLTRADAAWLGMLLIGLTLVSAVLLLRPVDWRQGSLLLLVLASPPLLLAVNRANHDLVVFVLMCGALACLRQERPVPRAFGVMLLAASAALKYFPLAAALILLDARTRRELLWWCLLYGLVLLLAWPSLEPGLRTAIRHTPAPTWLYAFGAPVVFRDFGIVAPTGWLLAGFLALIAATSWPAILAARTSPREAADRTPEREFTCGAVMVVGCFLHGSSYIYKMVFTLWLLPWLWRVPPATKEERWRNATFTLLLAVLWLEGSMATVINICFFTSIVLPATANQMLEITLVVSQLLTWALVACLWRALLIHTGRQVTRLAAP